MSNKMERWSQIVSEYGLEEVTGAYYDNTTEFSWRLREPSET